MHGLPAAPPARLFRAVIVLFKQTGDAPILKQNRVKVRGKLCCSIASAAETAAAAAAASTPLHLFLHSRSAGKSRLPKLSNSCGASWARIKWCADACCAFANLEAGHIPLKRPPWFSHADACFLMLCKASVRRITSALPPQFVYLKEAFSPALEERICVLYEAFGVDGRLVVNYATVPAWG